MGVPTSIYAFHRYTGNSTRLSIRQAYQYPTLYLGLSPSL